MMRTTIPHQNWAARNDECDGVDGHASGLLVWSTTRPMMMVVDQLKRIEAAAQILPEKMMERRFEL
jgi:hypothetical protein